VRTAEDFVEFLRAIRASPADAPKPTPLERFLGAHPAALKFVQTPQPLPTSFAKESYFAVNAYKFTNRDGASRFGRHRIRPEGGGEYFDQATAERQSSNVLFDEIGKRLTKGPVKIRISVQVANAGDVVDDSTVHWPDDRSEIDFGTVALESILPNNDAEQQHI